MESTDADRSPSVPGEPGTLPRRGVLGGASALAAGGMIPTGIPIGGAVPPARARASGQIVAYVGAYTDRGKGIHLFHVDLADGALVPWKIVDGLPNPSSLAFDPAGRYLYAVN